MSCIAVLGLSTNPEYIHSQKNLTQSYPAANSYYTHVTGMKLMPLFHSSLHFLAYHHDKVQMLRDCVLLSEVFHYWIIFLIAGISCLQFLFGQCRT